MEIHRFKLLLVFCIASTALAATDRASYPAPVISVRIINLAQVPNETLRCARIEASQILHLAGLDVNWLSCDGDACSRDLGPDEFWLSFTNRRPHPSTKDMLGSTQFVGGLEYGSSMINYPSALMLADLSRIHLAQILAVAMVHEIGHLILGPYSHSSQGVMAPGYGPDQLQLIPTRWLRFTAEQSRLLQNEVRRRNSEWGGRDRMEGR